MKIDGKGGSRIGRILDYLYPIPQGAKNCKLFVKRAFQALNGLL